MRQIALKNYTSLQSLSCNEKLVSVLAFVILTQHSYWGSHLFNNSGGPAHLHSHLQLPPFLDKSYRIWAKAAFDRVDSSTRQSNKRQSREEGVKCARCME